MNKDLTGLSADKPQIEHICSIKARAGRKWKK